jgi:hypothetical protein
MTKLDNILKSMDYEISRDEHTMVYGICGNMEDYRRIAGRLEAFRIIRSIIEAEKKREDEEDDV